MNDPDAVKRVGDAFRRHFPAERVQSTAPTTASEDFGSFGAEWGVPSVFWFVGGTDPGRLRQGPKGRQARRHSHQPQPALRARSFIPTLETGVEALVVAAQAWLRVQARMIVEPALIKPLLVGFDLGGTFVFALSGAMVAVKHRLDLFGVLVLSFAAGNAGGITRDLMIGALPPAAMSDWRYVAVCILAGLITFYWYRAINRLSGSVLIFDAAGLALFAVSGAGKALAFHTRAGRGHPARHVDRNRRRHDPRCAGQRKSPPSCAPNSTRSRPWSARRSWSAADMLNVPSADAAIAGAVLCFGLRFMAIRRGWQLPIARPLQQQAERPGPSANKD